MSSTISIFNFQRIDIHIEDIKYVEGLGNYSQVHLHQKKSILTARTLKRMSMDLPSFIRIHKKYLINPRFVDAKQLPSKKQLVLVLTSGEALTVSRRRLAALLHSIYK